MSYNHLKITQPASKSISFPTIPPRNFSVNMIVSMIPPDEIYE